LVCRQGFDQPGRSANDRYVTERIRQKLLLSGFGALMKTSMPLVPWLIRLASTVHFFQGFLPPRPSISTPAMLLIISDRQKVHRKSIAGERNDFSGDSFRCADGVDR
jgi:hypothetical protein